MATQAVIDAKAEKMRAQWARERAEAKIERLNASLAGTRDQAERAKINEELKATRSVLSERQTAEAKAVKALAAAKSAAASTPKGQPNNHGTNPKVVREAKAAAARKGPRGAIAPEPIPAPRKRRTKAEITSQPPVTPEVTLGGRDVEADLAEAAVEA